MAKKLTKHPAEKLKHKHYYDEVYRRHFVFLLNVSDDKEIERILKKNYKNTYKAYMEAKKTTNVSADNAGGINIQLQYREIIIVKKQKGNFFAPAFYGCLAHECLHAMMHIFKDIGVDYTDQHNEHFTYYIEMLVRIALE